VRGQRTTPARRPRAANPLGVLQRQAQAAGQFPHAGHEGIGDGQSHELVPAHGAGQAGAVGGCHPQSGDEGGRERGRRLPDRERLLAEVDVVGVLLPRPRRHDRRGVDRGLLMKGRRGHALHIGAFAPPLVRNFPASSRVTACAARLVSAGDRLGTALLMADSRLIRTLRVRPGERPRLDARDPADRLGLTDKASAEERLRELVVRLAVLQNRLWAESARSVLLVLQGLDASGKDGTIRKVLTGVNPQGCRVVSFKAPAGVELAHDYLWRVHAVCPVRGEIGIFNRSHYEDVVAVHVRGLAPARVWRRRPAHIREFERLLSDEGTTLVKVYLHISREEQGKRLQQRLDDPEKRWKFRPEDLDDRKRWDDFQAAYEDVLHETSSDWAPWHVVPADRKWVRNVAVAELLVATLERMDPKLPTPYFEDVTIE
jgi:PPK2 family polyphosphate:nucleotide phosphotransferase